MIDDNYFTIALVIFTVTMVGCLIKAYLGIRNSELVFDFDLDIPREQIGFSVLIPILAAAYSVSWFVTVPLTFVGIVSYYILKLINRKA